MKLRIKTSIVGAFYSYNAGDVRDVPDDEARRLVNAGYAEPVKSRRTAPVRTPEMDIEQELERALSPDGSQ